MSFRTMWRHLVADWRAWRARRRFRSNLAKHRAARAHLQRHLDR